MKQTRYIVLGAEHYNPLGVIRSLGEAGIRPIAIILRNDTMRLASKSKYISTVHFVDTVKEGIELLIQRYGSDDSANETFVYTTDDTFGSIVDKYYDCLNGKFIFFQAGTANRVTYFMNKDNVMNLAKKHGLDVLDYQVVKTNHVPEGLEYPVITKAVDSTKFGWKSAMFICHDANELKRAFNSIESDEVVVQKYIIKKNEYCLDGFSTNHGKNLFLSIASEYKYQLAITYSSYMDVSNFDKPELYQKLNNIMADIGFEGIFSIEFLIDQSGHMFFSEINFRNSTWSYASTCAGMNLPVLWAEQMQGANYTQEDMYRPIKPGFTAMVEVDDFIVRVKKGDCSFIRWLKDMISANCKFLIGRHADYGPVISFVKSYSMKKIKKVFRL